MTEQTYKPSSGSDRRLVRNPHGSMRREVPLADVAIADVRSYALYLPNKDKHWINGVTRYYEELSLFLAAMQAGLELPESLYVPDLWHLATRLAPGEEREQVLDVWSLGHDLGESVGYAKAYPQDFEDYPLFGTIFYKDLIPEEES